MIKLSPEDQHYFSKDHPAAFAPIKGTWGRRGATSVHLKSADKDVLEKAIQAAWRFNTPKRVQSNKVKRPPSFAKSAKEGWGTPSVRRHRKLASRNGGVPKSVPRR